MYRVLGGNRTTPGVGTRDDDALGTDESQKHLVNRGNRPGPAIN
jgi:hypothetical protein